MVPCTILASLEHRSSQLLKTSRVKPMQAKPNADTALPLDAGELLQVSGMCVHVCTDIDAISVRLKCVSVKFDGALVQANMKPGACMLSPEQ